MKRLTQLSVLFLTIYLLSITQAQAQNNVGIGTTTPNPKAILELNATDKGLLVPRVDSAQMVALAGNATTNGLLVYNTTKNCFYYWNANASAWKSMCTTEGLLTKGDTIVIKILKTDSIYSSVGSFDTLMVNGISIDSLIKQVTTNYLSNNKDTVVIKFLQTDSIYSTLGRFDTLMVNGISIDSLIKQVTNNYLSNSKDTIVIKYLQTDSIYTTIVRADTSISNYTIINNGTINNVTIDSTTTNYTTINNGVINNLTVDSSVTNVSTVNIIKGDSATFNTITVGGQNILNVISDSIKNAVGSTAWLLQGNNAPATNKLGTLNAQDLHIVANNNERITILNGTGNVGINQTLPSAKLDVVGDIKFTGPLKPAGLQGTTGQVLTSNGALAPTWTTTTVSNTYNNSTGNLSTTVNGVTGANVNLPTNQAITDSITAQAWTLKGNANINPNTNFLGTTTNNSLRFRTNNTEKMIVDSTGNVGIGTTTPTSKLTVQGAISKANISTSNTEKIMDSPITGSASEFFGQDLHVIRSQDDAMPWGAALRLYTYSNTDPNDIAMRKARGTRSSPSFLLAGDVLGQVSFSSINHTSNIFTGQSRGGAAILSIVSENHSATNNGVELAFNTTTNGTMAEHETMRLANNGNVGIGRSAPFAKLHVRGVDTTYNSGLLVESPNALQWLDILPGYAANGTTTAIQENLTMTLRSTGFASGNIAFASGVSEWMRIANTGNVGIGTTTPANKLEVNSGTAGNSGLRLTNLTNAGVLSTDVNGDVINNTTPNPANGLFWGLTGNAGTLASTNFIGTTDNKSLRFRTNNTEKMIVDSTGNVGIGTTAPAEKLQVVDGNISMKTIGTTTPVLKWNASDNSTRYSISGFTESIGATTDELRITNTFGFTSFFNNGAERVRIDASGRMGIGTTNPLKALHIKPAGTPDGLLIDDNSNRFFAITVNTGNGSNNGLTLAGDRVISWGDAFNANTTGLTIGPWDSGAKGMRIDGASGNVGIGTNTPVVKLDVVGDIRASTTLAFQDNVRIPITNIDVPGLITTPFQMPAYGICTPNVGTSAQTWISGNAGINFFTNFGTAPRMSIDGNGNIGMGTQNPTQKLHVVGNILASGTITPSDARYKQNIVTLNNSLSNVLKLRGVTYDMKAEYKDKGFGTGTQIGVIAQEVEAIYPALINTSADGYKGVDYSKFTPILIEAIKELNAKHNKEIEILLKRIEALEKK
jgi:trimeric autotransporter adhesin